MAEHKQPKIVNGIIFVWVPHFEGSHLREHWLAASGINRVQVFEPATQAGSWTARVDAHVNHHPDPGNFSENCHPASEKDAFDTASHWALHGILRKY